MLNKNHYGLIYLHNYRSVSQPRNTISNEKALENTLNGAASEKAKKASLVFLSTIMQTSNNAIHGDPIH